ncbi:hypothetical protein, partial [Streptococcus pneumoniae]|uniref:hypothetical protein n=1 Tax=Streptococcus pneumoniae TaxID=1313 RepID=UPI001E58FF54
MSDSLYAVRGAATGGGGGASPTVAEGDLIIRGASADERLAIGGAGKVLTSNGTTATWEVGSP